jgi:hypothetical protein
MIDSFRINADVEKEQTWIGFLRLTVNEHEKTHLSGFLACGVFADRAEPSVLFVDLSFILAPVASDKKGTVDA